MLIAGSYNSIILLATIVQCLSICETRLFLEFESLIAHYATYSENPDLKNILKLNVGFQVVLLGGPLNLLVII